MYCFCIVVLVTTASNPGRSPILHRSIALCDYTTEPQTITKNILTLEVSFLVIRSSVRKIAGTLFEDIYIFSST